MKINPNSLRIAMVVVTCMQRIVMINSNPLQIATNITCLQRTVKINPNSLQAAMGQVKKEKEGGAMVKVKKKKKEEGKANKLAAASYGVSNTQSQATGVPTLIIMDLKWG